MSAHTEKCKIGDKRLRKKFVWLTFCTGYVVFLEEIIVEEEYREKFLWKIESQNVEPTYYWKVIKKWTVEQFENKHGKFKEELIKKHRRF